MFGAANSHPIYRRFEVAKKKVAWASFNMHLKLRIAAQFKQKHGKNLWIFVYISYQVIVWLWRRLNEEAFELGCGEVEGFRALWPLVWRIVNKEVEEERERGIGELGVASGRRKKRAWRV